MWDPDALFCHQRDKAEHTFLGVDVQVTIALICRNHIDIKQISYIEFSFVL